MRAEGLTEWKKTDEPAFLGDVSSVPLQQCLRHLQAAFTDFFAQRAKYQAVLGRRAGGVGLWSRCKTSTEFSGRSAMKQETQRREL